MSSDEIMEIIRAHLVLRIEDGGFTDVNRRNVKVMWDRGGRMKPVLLCEASFDVTQRPEYEG